MRINKIKYGNLFYNRVKKEIKKVFRAGFFFLFKFGFFSSMQNVFVFSFSLIRKTESSFAAKLKVCMGLLIYIKLKDFFLLMLLGMQFFFIMEKRFARKIDDIGVVEKLGKCQLSQR